MAETSEVGNRKKQSVCCVISVCNMKTAKQVNKIFCVYGDLDIILLMIGHEKNLSKAWKNYEVGNYKKSEYFFKIAIKNEKIAEKCDSILSNYGYTLVALKHFDKAIKIYERLFKKYRNHIYIHQLGMVEREAGHYKKALKLYFKEKAMLDKKDNLAKAANLYELGKNNELLGRFIKAKKYADKCIQVSNKCDDFIMKACSFRLAGDIEKHRNVNGAIGFYKRAKRYFDKADDKIGVKDIDSIIIDLKRLPLKKRVCR